jgi:excisionase family DNA binding protein
MLRVVAKQEDMAMNVEERLLSPSDVARLLDVPVATLYAWRYRSSGPRAVRVGRHLRYRRADVESWLDAGGSETIR